MKKKSVSLLDNFKHKENPPAQMNRRREVQKRSEGGGVGEE
jgi:hypothetical protein